MTTKTLTSNWETVLIVLQTGMNVLAARVLTLLTLLMTFGLFCWAMYLGTIYAGVLAGGFGVIIFLPVLTGERRKKETTHVESSDG